MNSEFGIRNAGHRPAGETPAPQKRPGILVGQASRLPFGSTSGSQRIDDRFDAVIPFVLDVDYYCVGGFEGS